MIWAYFTIFAVIIWSIVNVIDKYIMKEHIRKPIVATTFFAVISLVAAIVIMSFTRVNIPTTGIFGFAILAGLFYTISNYFYYKSILNEDITRVIPLYAITPIFVLLLSAPLLGEFLSITQYIGIALVIMGSVLISLRRDVKFKISRVLFYMLLGTLFLAFNYVVTKQVLNTLNFWDTFFWVRIGSAVVIPFFLVLHFNSIKSTINNSPRGIVYQTFNEALNVVGVLLFTAAISFGFVSLASTLSEVQPIFVLLFAIILSLYKPWIIKEELKGSTLLMKTIAIIIIIVGSLLIL